MHINIKYVYNINTIYIKFIDILHLMYYIIYGKRVIFMASSTSIINVNVPSEVKKEANEIFTKLGLNMSTAINIFLKRSIFAKGLPFDVTLPDDDLSQYFSKKELMESAKELKYIQSHLEEYEKNNNWEDLKKEILKK